MHLGRYEILLGIAQGGMARVWAARQHGQRGFSKTVAIKTILPTLAEDPEFETMFLDEARVASGVHHPNVCEIFDLGEENGVLYLAMEWVNGDSLARILKPGSAEPGGKKTPIRINARIAARIVSDASAGLHGAHELCDVDGNRLNVVHRDVSPQNILVSVDGNVKVTDFGVAKAFGSAHQATMAGQVKGKAAYMAPEQAAGGRIDRRSDIFALGIVLYEITTGQRPFSGENQVSTLKALMDGRFDPPSALVPGYPRELEAIVMRAMAMDPMQRFPTADRMRVALEEWLARSGPVVTQTQVAAVIRERLGHVIDERRGRIRQMLQQSSEGRRATGSFSVPGETSSSKISNPSQTSNNAISNNAISNNAISNNAISNNAISNNAISHASATGLSGVAGTPPPLAAPRRGAASTALLGVSIGLGAFVVIAGLGLGGWALLRQHRAAAATPHSATAAAVAPSAKAPTASASASATTAAPPTPAAVIQLHNVIPKSGVSFALDGKPLPKDKKQIPRPAHGKVSLLTVKADGYQQDVLRIDDNTPDVLDILLAKVEPDTEAKPKPTAAAAATPHPTWHPKAAAVAKPSVPKASGKKPAIKPDIPDNPF